MRHILIVGLGNPGNQYAFTRHNAGFLAVDRISEHLEFPSFIKKGNALMSDKLLGDDHVILLKPQTFMNLSGNAVSPIVSFFKVAQDDTYVLHDDIDLKLGGIKMKFGGSSGGHNGIKSLDSHISERYWRIRIGIGRPERNIDVADYVLGRFNADEFEQLYVVADSIALNIQKAFVSDKPKFVQDVLKTLSQRISK